MTQKVDRGIRLNGYLPPQNDKYYRLFYTEEGSPSGEIDLGISPLRHFVKRKGPIPDTENVFWYEVGTGAKILYAFRKAKKTGKIEDIELEDKLTEIITVEELDMFTKKINSCLIKTYHSRKK